MAKGCNNASNKKTNSSKPYDASNSFVKKVASRVTGLIPQTSWLSGWFSTPDEVSDSPDTAQTSRFNNDEGSSEDQLDQPPPSKRIKLPDRNYESEMFTRSGCSKETIMSPQGDFLDMSSVPGPSGQQRGGSAFVASTPAEQEHKANGDDCSESAESTSGCSSLEPQMNRAPGVVGQQSRPNESLPSRFLDDRFNYPSYLQSPRSLFLEKSTNSRSNQSASRRKPSFSVTSLSSSLFGDRSLNETMVNSPFYSGRTMYGGASSSPYRRSLGSTSFTSSASNDKAGRHTVKVKPSPAQSSADTGMSETARRILATLEQFSTPLLDAKRIPVSASPQPVLASTSRKRTRQETEEPRILLNQPRSPHLTRKGVHWAKGPPVKELTVPSTPDTLVLHRKERFTSDEAFLRQKERLQDTTTAARRMANSIPASNIGLERIYTLRSEDNEPSSGKQQSLKMKSDMRTNVRQSKTVKKDEPPEEVNLPKIALPITTLPSFDISVAKPIASTPPSTTPKVAVPSMATTSTPLSTPKAPTKTTPAAASFTFASPIVVASDHKPISPVAFVFSKPETVGEEKAPPSTGLNFLPSVPSRPDKPGLKRKSVVVNENGSDPVVFSLKPPSELRTGSVMDILGKGAKDTKEVNGSVSLMDKFKPAAGTWECDQCLIRNKADLARCAACTNPRPAAGGKVTSNAPATTDLPQVPSSATKNDSGFGAQFKLAGSDMWECSSCMVRNKSDTSQCVACGTAKPGTAPATKPVTTTSSWGDKFKPASNTWECEACMVRNSTDLNACQACTTKRPGAATSAASTASSSSTSNTTSLVTSGWGDKFKKAEGSWDCTDCMVTNKSVALKCVACGAKKPGTESEETTPSSAPKFSFGVPAGTSGFTFGVKPSEKTEDKPAVATGFKFGETPVSVPTTGFSFGIPAAAQASSSLTTTAPATTTAISTVAASDKPAFSFSVSKQTSETKTDSSAQDKGATFSFGQTSSASSEPSRKRKSSAEASETSASSTELSKLPAPSPMFSASVGNEATAAPNKTSIASPAAAKSVESATPQKAPPTFNFASGSPASLFMMFGADTTGTSSPKPSTVTSTADFKPNHELKSFAVSSTTSTANTTFAFGQSSSEASKPAAATFSATTEASTPAKSFSFGQPSSEALKTSKDAGAPNPSNAFAPPPAKFTFMLGQTTSEPSKTTEAPKTTVTFGATPAADAREKTTFSFQPLSDTASKPLTGFGTPANTSAAPIFGSSTNAFSTLGSNSAMRTPSLIFGSGGPVSVTAPAASNLSPASTPAAPGLTFGAANSVPSFGSSFGSTDKTETKAPGTFTFGATSKPATAAPFAFGAQTSTVNGPTFGTPQSAPKTFATFNVPPSNNAPTPTPTFGNFGASSSAPVAPAPAASPFGAANATPLFGSSNPPVFGAPSQPAFSAPTPAFGAAATNPTPAPQTMFNFSANSTAAPVFRFGSNAPQNSAPPTPFSFTAKPAQAPPAFNPNVTPNFNFSSGGAVNFTATPGESKPIISQRVIKKAMRRTQPR